MIWPVLAGGTALFYALHGGWSTRMSRRIGVVLAGWTLFSFALPILLVYLSVRGIPEVGIGFWPAWGVAVVGNLAAWYLFFTALRLGDLGITYPLLALTPVFVVPVEWALLREIPAAGGLLGIGLVVVGIYLLHFHRIRTGLFAPFAFLIKDRAAVRALATAVIWSVTGTLDRVAVLESSPAFYGFMLSAGLSLLFLPFALVAVRAGDSSSRAESWQTRFRLRLAPAGRGALLLHGLLFACMLVLQMEALTLQLASYVLSIKRTGAVVAVILGHFAFREGALGPRLTGTLVTLFGAFVLVVWG